MVMVLVLVGVRMQVEVAVPPTHKEPERQEHDQRGDGRLGALLHPLRQELLEEEDRQSEEHERERVTESPERPEPGCCPTRALLPRGNERGHCGDVVGIRRMTEAEERSDEDHDEVDPPAERLAIASSRPNMVGIRLPFGIGSDHARQGLDGQGNADEE